MIDPVRGILAAHDVVEDLAELVKSMQEDPSTDVRAELPELRRRLVELLIDLAKLYAAVR